MAIVKSSILGTICTPQGKTFYLVQGENEVEDQDILDYLADFEGVEIVGQSELDL